jgi:hypothetical protein
MADAHEKLTQEITKEHQLKHVETQDKSAPKIEGKSSASLYVSLIASLGNVQLKKIDREGFLKEVEKGTELKHTETKDSSAPKVDSK